MMSAISFEEIGDALHCGEDFADHFALKFIGSGPVLFQSSRSFAAQQGVLPLLHLCPERNRQIIRGPFGVGPPLAPSWHRCGEIVMPYCSGWLNGKNLVNITRVLKMVLHR